MPFDIFKPKFAYDSSTSRVGFENNSNKIQPTTNSLAPMKVVILTGGFGTRISEESQTKPKPMIEIGGMPILWYIMKEYSYYGYHEFIICAGYQQVCIKDWFANYFRRLSDYTIDFTGAKEIVQIHECHVEPWRVTLVDTGLNTMTGGRIKRIQKYVGDEL